MFDQFQLKTKGRTWRIIARKGAGTATEAAWVTLGGCSSQIVALRVYRALIARGGR